MSASSPVFHSLLIGINAYLPNHMPNGASYRNLNGCLHDIELIEGLLKQRLNMPDDRIVKLTSTVGANGQPTESPDRLPTYANMVAAIQGLTQRCSPGDSVYIHYSGHGGRATTHYPDIKPNGQDEGLAPVDIGTADYLRDVELAYLFKALVDYGLILFVVLDCCSSGGAIRGEATARGIDVLDTTLRSNISVIASSEALVATWQTLNSDSDTATRGLEGVLLGLPEPKGYTLLAACRAHESAYEFPFASGQPNGALTYFICESLNALGFGITYRHLYNRVLGNIRTSWIAQTAQLFGEADRILFGVKEAQANYGVNVLSYDAANQIVVLNTGLALGVNNGTQFAIYPADVINLEKAIAIAQAEVIAADAAESHAHLLTPPNSPIQPGMQALLTQLSETAFISRVRFLPNYQTSQSHETPIFAKVRNAWAAQSSPYTLLTEEGAADFYLTIEADATFQILNPLREPLKNIPQVFPVADSATPTRLAQSLAHLGKFSYVLKLNNQNPDSSLWGKLQVDLLDANHQPVRALGEDEKATLIVKNNSAFYLNVVILVLNADWSIVQLHKKDIDFIPLDPNFELSFDIYGSGRLNGLQESRDVLKIFATRVSMSLRSLELPPLAQVFDVRLSDRPADKVSLKDWTTEQIEVLSR
ncbi:MAG: caspase family protein [Chloroflexota bacterium]